MTAMLGGPFFAATLVVSAIFTLALFTLRADPIFTLPASIAEAGHQDFIAFWRAGEMALEGRAAEAYDPAAFQQGFAPGAEGLFFLNPPHFFLLMWPFSLLSYGAAKALWLALSAVALGAVGALAGKDRRQKVIFAVFILLSPAAFSSFLPAQIAPLITLGTLAALLIAKDRPVAAGLLLAVVTVKPQYGLLIPVFLAARGEWRAFAAAAGFSALIIAVSVVIYGAGAWAAFLQFFGSDALPHGKVLMRDAYPLHQTVGKLGGGTLAKAGIQLGGILVCAALVWTAARRWSRNAAIGLTLIASTFVAPSLWVYDWPFFVAGLFMLAREQERWPLAFQSVAALLWIAPLISLGFQTMESSLAAPVIAAAAITVIHFQGGALFRGGPYSSTGVSSGGGS